MGKGIIDRLREILEEINRRADAWVDIDYVLSNAIVVRWFDDVSPYPTRSKRPGYIVVTREGLLVRVYENEKYVSVESIHDCVCECG